MDDLAAALASFDSASGQSQKAMYGAALAEAARRLLDEGFCETSYDGCDDDDGLTAPSSPDKSGCVYLGVSMNGTRPFTYDGTQYDSIQNAFQAQKAPRSERAEFSNVMPSEAVKMGRSCKIDPVEWDANRVALMTELYRAQVAEHRDMADTLYRWRIKAIKEDAIPDPFWQKTMPTIWKTIGREMLMADGAGDDDEADKLGRADGEECAQMVHGHHKPKKMRR